MLASLAALILPTTITIRYDVSILQIAKFIMQTTRNHTIYSVFIWFVAALSYFFQYGLMVIPQVLTKNLTSILSTNSFAIGILSSAYLYTYVLLQIPAGILIDKTSSRKILFYSMLLMTLGNIIFTFSHNIYLSIIARLIMGIGGSTTFVGTLAILRRYFKPQLYPLFIGLTEAMTGLGSVTMTVAMLSLENSYSLQSAFNIISASMVIVALLILSTIKHTPLHENITDQNSSWQHFIAVIKNARLWLLGIFTGLSFTTISVMGNMWNIPLLQHTYHIKTMDAIWINSLMLLGFISGSVIIGFLAEFFGDTKLIVLFSILQTITVFLAFIVHLPLFLHLIDLYFIGLASSCTILCFNLARRIMSTHYQGIASGFINMFFGAMGIPMIPLIGWLIRYRQHYNILLLVKPILFASIIATMLSLVIYSKFLQKSHAKRYKIH